MFNKREAKHTGRLALALTVVLVGLLLPRTLTGQARRDSSEFRFRPDLSIRTNLLLDGIAAPNVGFDVAVSDHWTLGASFALKAWPRWFAWDWDSDKASHWRFFSVEPEVRWWRTQPFDGWFAGADFTYTHFNIGDVTFPLGLYKDFRDFRLQGSWWGGGLFAGYSWRIGRRWRIEAEAGISGGMAAYDKYDCPHCGSLLGAERRGVAVPRLGVNLAWNLLDRQEQDRLRERDAVTVSGPGEVVEHLVLPPPVAFVVKLRQVEAPPTAGDSLARENAWVIPIEQYRPLDYHTRPGRDSILYVRYPVDSHELDLGYEGNGDRLGELTAALERLQADPRCDELIISVVGLASFDGPQERNDTLGIRRARAVADYIMESSGLPRRHFEIIGKGEAWDWFQAQIADESAGLAAADVQALQDIIAGTPDPDERERRIRADRRLYRDVVRHLLADQRTAGYIRVYYGNSPDPATEKLNSEIARLIVAKQYRRAVFAIESDEALTERVQSDPEAMNAYAVARYFTALDDKDTAREEEALAMLETAARRGSDAARQNLAAAREYGPARHEYEAWQEMEKLNNKL